MPTALKPNAIRLISEKPRHPQKPPKRKPVPWVDVGDDAPASPRKRNATAMNGDHHHHHGRKHKKARHSHAPADEDVPPPRKAGPSAANNSKAAALQEQRSQLPIALGRDALIDEIRKNDVTVLLGETGSGKTTQVPQYILESGLAGSGTIAITQPRKVAATSLALRVSAEQSTPLGALVGYAVRFDDRSSAGTRIKYMTDGMLVRELLSDPLLKRYSVIVVDEAHERTLRTDLLLTNLKSIQATRNSPSDPKGKKPANPLKLVIMSATLDAEKFARFFRGAKILYVQGRQHPVTIYHSAAPQSDYLDAALRTFFQIHTDQPPGDVLIFLPGQEDIEALQASITTFALRLPQDAPEVHVAPMFAAQAPGQNAKAFLPAPEGTRKCILATNIAETSITIPGVRYVIDTGKSKEKRYLARDTGGGFDTLLTKDITKSSALQRTGRAGREGPGTCFRLYTESAFAAMPAAAEPEILRVSLTASMLQLRCLGQRLEELELMDRPDEDSIVSALKSLWLLQALDNTATLTPLGRQMASFPLEPPHARALLASAPLGCTAETLTIISLLSASAPLFLDVSTARASIAEARQKFAHPAGDHLTLLNAVRAYEEVAKAENKGARREWCKKHFLNERALLEGREIRQQLVLVCKRLGMDVSLSCGEKEEPVVRSLGHGLAMNSAFLQPDGSYKQTMGQTIVKIHPGSVLCDKKVPAIVYDELIYTNQIYARGVSSIPRSFFASHAALNQRQA